MRGGACELRMKSVRFFCESCEVHIATKKFYGSNTKCTHTARPAKPKAAHTNTLRIIVAMIMLYKCCNGNNCVNMIYDSWTCTSARLDVALQDDLKRVGWKTKARQRKKHISNNLQVSTCSNVVIICCSNSRNISAQCWRQYTKLASRTIFLCGVK